MRPAILLLALVACSKTETIRPDAPVPRAEPQPAPESTDFKRIDTLPPQFAALGTPCQVAAEGCGMDGRIASVKAGVMGPMGVQGLYIVRKGSDNLNETVAIGFDQERVWTITSCPMCRVMSSSVAVLTLRTSKDADLAAIQRDLGLPAAPLLRSPTAFRDALVRAGYSHRG
jgi:hypothetical protein